jgi:hypothetical protein
VRHAIVLLLLGGLAVGTTAVAQDSGEPVDPPIVRSGSVLHLQSSRPCHGSAGVTLRVTPPAGVSLGWLSVRVDGRQVVRLTGVAGSASVTVRVPRRGGRVATSAETLDGRRFSRGQRYRSCVRPPTPSQPRRGTPPPITGGGET